MIEVGTQTTEVEVINSVEVTSTSQVEVETVDLSDLDITVAKKEYVITGDDIYIPMLYDDAPQWMKDLVQLVVDVSISSGNQNLINDLSTMLQDFAVSYVPLNQYTQTILDLGDEDTRINALIETLNSNFNDGLSTANAQIISLQLTKASKDEVVAQVIQTIAAQLADGTSNIGSIIGRIDQAIANETSARATSFQVLTSSLEDTNLDIAANATATHALNTYVGLNDATGDPNGTGLLADVSAIASDVTTLNTNLQSGAGTWASADSNLINSLSTSITNGDVAVESKFAYNSIVNINGVYKKSGFGLTTNYTSGNGTQANPYVSEFWIDASRLKFTNSNQTGQTAPFTIDASGANPQIKFNGIVNFSNVTNTTGTGSNLLYNSAPKIGSETKGWYVWTNSGMTVNLSAGFDVWKPTGGASVAANIGGSPSIGSVFDVGQSSNFPVIAGSRYEASAYISAHRTNSYVFVVFYDAAGNYAGEASGNVINYAGSSALVNWGRSSTFTTAPSNAATARCIIRSVVTGNDPYCFVAYAFTGVAGANQTTPSNWSEGTSAGATYTSELSNDAGFTTLGAVSSSVNSGIYSNNDVFAQKLGYTNYASMVAAASNGQSIINGGYLRTSLIQADQIIAGGILANSVLGNTISGSTITGSKIYGAQIEGSVIKASFIDLTSTATLTNWQQYTPANYPSQYAANFAHKNDGTLLVDSSGYVRLMGNTNIVGQPYYFQGKNYPGAPNIFDSTINAPMSGSNTGIVPYNSYWNSSVNRCIVYNPTFSLNGFDISTYKQIVRIAMDTQPGGYVSFRLKLFGDDIIINNGFCTVNGINIPSSGGSGAPIVSARTSNLGFIYRIGFYNYNNTNIGFTIDSNTHSFVSSLFDNGYPIELITSSIRCISTGANGAVYNYLIDIPSISVG